MSFLAEASAPIEARLDAARLRLEAFQIGIDYMSQAICMFDAKQRIVVANKPYADLYDLTEEQIVPGTTLEQICRYRIAHGIFGEGDPERYVRERTAPVTNDSDQTQELSDGRTVLIRRRVLPDGGWITTHEDITCRLEAERKVAHAATHDGLTGLPNRLLFAERLDLILARVDRGEKIGVFWIDLDRFKSVNDAFGHAAGDELLRQVAERLKAELRETDLISRLSGDEFAVAQTQVGGPADCAKLAQRLIDALSRSYDVFGNAVTVGASIGVRVAAHSGEGADDLLRCADLALYRAKDQGRGVYRFYDHEMDMKMQARKELEHELRAAMPGKQLELYYQPLVDVRRREVCSVEVLLRWRHPRRGIVAPGEFIPIAEESGLIIPIGEWVMRRACQDAARWDRPLRVAVNVSACQFRFGDPVAMVRAALALSGLDPKRLEIEITESLLLDNVEATIAALKEIKALGVSIAMDDFGTGYSSLSYLSAFPFDKIKIDRSFTKDIQERGSALNIMRSIAGLGASLGISTTAEGVETSAQLELAESNGCTEIQGYYFTEPRPAAELPDMIEMCEAKLRAAPCDAEAPEPHNRCHWETDGQP